MVDVDKKRLIIFTKSLFSVIMKYILVNYFMALEMILWQH